MQIRALKLSKVYCYQYCRILVYIIFVLDEKLERRKVFSFCDGVLGEIDENSCG